MKLIFLDFEASSLDPGSFPIEVAWVTEAGHGESYLIRPQEDWRAWSPASQRIHGIARDVLEAEGVAASAVASRAHAAFRNATLVSDNPGFDAYWMGMLLQTAGHPPLPLVDVHRLLGHEMQRIGVRNTADPASSDWHRQVRLLLDEAQVLVMSAYEGAQIGHKTQHRALPDAQALWRCWLAAKQAMDQRLGKNTTSA